jgi:hypothetical protein
MCADEANVNRFGGHNYQYHKAIVIPVDVEHITLIANIIHTIKGLPNIGKVVPFSPTGFFKPIVETSYSLRMVLGVLGQCLFGNDSHNGIFMFYAAKIMKKFGIAK